MIKSPNNKRFFNFQIIKLKFVNLYLLYFQFSLFEFRRLLQKIDKDSTKKTISSSLKIEPISSYW